MMMSVSATEHHFRVALLCQYCCLWFLAMLLLLLHIHLNLRRRRPHRQTQRTSQLLKCNRDIEKSKGLDRHFAGWNFSAYSYLTVLKSLLWRNALFSFVFSSFCECQNVKSSHTSQRIWSNNTLWLQVYFRLPRSNTVFFEVTTLIYEVVCGTKFPIQTVELPNDKKLILSTLSLSMEPTERINIFERGLRFRAMWPICFNPQMHTMFKV